jgi:hypothetical protein
MHTGNNKSLYLIIGHESGSDNNKVFPLLGRYAVYVEVFSEMGSAGCPEILVNK